MRSGQTHCESGYGDVDSMWAAMIGSLLDSPDLRLESRAGSGPMSRELLGTRWRLNDVRRNFLCNAERSACPAYASAELLWYLSREDSVEMLLAYAPSYKRFAEPNGRAHGGYGHRIATNIDDQDQLTYAVHRLKRDPSTRQLVITMWKPADLVTEDKKDVPCTIGWQFFVRENHLHMIAYMRSNDIWLGTPYDIYAFTCVQRMLADSLGLVPGHYTHVAGSLHLYEKNFEQALLIETPTRPTPVHGWTSCPIEDDEVAVAYERLVRLNETVPEKFNKRRITGCLADSVSCCARKLGSSTAIVTSPALQKGFQNVDRRRTRLGGQDHARQEDSCQA